MTTIETAPVPNCDLCGMAGRVLFPVMHDRQLGVPGEWSLMQCSGCRLIWLNPRPLPHEIMKLYADDYYTHRTAKRAVAGRIQRLKSALAVGGAAVQRPNIVGRSLGRLGPLRDEQAAGTLWIDPDTQPGRVLDVGCGTGDFLLRMKALGWHAQGVEPDPAAAALATQAGLAVECGTLTTASFPPESFDLVTASHVIEHVIDPVELLRDCARVLRPGGRIVVVTPNTRSLSRRAMGSRWYAWEIPRHLMMFSPSLLADCARRAGLHSPHVTSSARAARHMWHLSRLLCIHGKLTAESPFIPARLRVEGLVFWAVEHGLTSWAPVGEELVMNANKHIAPS